MQELIDSLLGMLRAMVRFRWTALLASALMAIVAWTVVFQQEDYYVARARVFVDSNRILEPLLRGIAVQPDVTQRVALMSRTLLTRPNLEKLARMTDLDIEATTRVEKEQLIDELARTITLRGSRNNESLYTVNYRSNDPLLARRMVQSLISIFIENTLGDERDDNESAQKFLDEQIAEYEERLTDAEQRLSNFKRKNAGKMPSEAGSYYQRLELAKSEARNTELSLVESEGRRAALRQQLSGQPRTISERSSSAPTETALESQISELEQELSSMQSRFTDRHPRIEQLRSNLSVLVRQQAVRISQGRPSVDGVFNIVTNPAYQEIVGLLAETEARIAELQIRAVASRDLVAELESTVESIPKIEATLKQLDRDYNVIQVQFDELLDRRESARLSEQVDQNVDDVKFRVIDPPFVPAKPSGPNKLLLSSAAFAIASGVGAALAFLISLLFPIYYDAQSLQKKSGYVVLGSVGVQKTRTKSFFDFFSSTIFLFFVGIFLLVYGLLMLYYSGSSLSLPIDQIMNSPVGPYIQKILDLAGQFLPSLSRLI